MLNPISAEFYKFITLWKQGELEEYQASSKSGKELGKKLKDMVINEVHSFGGIDHFYVRMLFEHIARVDFDALGHKIMGDTPSDLDVSEMDLVDEVWSDNPKLDHVLGNIEECISSKIHALSDFEKKVVLFDLIEIGREQLSQLDTQHDE